ncbi:PAS domain-containing sensor histidine kinase [Bacillus sp. FJAT-42315]|uniref:PAS domain-containing sensor histidine kinase n=1 Tax=Bacillus sp. FJAT-42315 TaxID=2014077 RepID=UPI000C24BC74|nr:PAS domain-containing sensor histidine kinase [Bacillus sp. FJAT-42315]
MKLFQSKLTKRYVVIVSVVVLFVLTLLYIIADNVMSKSVRLQIEYRDELITKALATQMESVLQNAVSDMRQVSPIVDSSDNSSKHFYQTEIEKVISQDPLYLFVEVYRQNEKQMRIPDIPFSGSIKIDPVLERLSWSKTNYVSNMMELPDGRKTMAIAYPWLDEQGNFRGAVVGYLNLNILSDYLQKFVIGKDGVNAVIDRNGMIIAHTNKDFIGSSLQSHEVGVRLEKGRFGLWEGNLFNEEMIVSYKPVYLGNIGLIVGEPTKQALSPVRSVTLLLIQGFIIVVLIAMGLAVFSASTVVHPIMLLIKQVQEYKEGKRKKFDILETDDEIEDLSLVLSEMATELREKERHLFYILESIPYGVITTDHDGRIRTFNKGAEKLMLYSREEVMGKLIFDLPIKHDIQEFVILKTLQKGKSFDEVESYIVDKEKQIHDVRIYASLFKGEKNEHIGSLLVIRDVSELKKLEGYLKQSERLASLGQLTAGIAHEIKNPLSIIQAAAETIRLQVDDELEEQEVIDELTNDILVSSDRMNKLLTDFLKLAKNDQDRDDLTTDVIPIMDELLKLLRRKFSDSDIEVTTNYQTVQAHVRGDRHKLTQILLNILLNSLQAMEDGGKIHLKLTDDCDYWKISVSDTGKGIPQAKLKWIFNPFYSTKPEGTGLGLSIAHEIVMQYGGNIWAESVEGEGATVYVQLQKGETDEKEHTVC